jgi:hypothetical protein
MLTTAGMTPTDSPSCWCAADLEWIRIPLPMPARVAVIRAINDAMADLEQRYSDACPQTEHWHGRSRVC